MGEKEHGIFFNKKMCLCGCNLVEEAVQTGNKHLELTPTAVDILMRKTLISGKTRDIMSYLGNPLNLLFADSDVVCQVIVIFAGQMQFALMHIKSPSKQVQMNGKLLYSQLP